MALCSSTKSTEQRLEAMKWFFGKRHCRTITFAADVAGSQDGKYFDLNVIGSDYKEKKYVIQLSDGTTTPAPVAPDQTLITVSYTSGASASAIAALFVTALAAIAVRCEQVGAAVEVQNHFVGKITTEVTTNAAGLTFAIGAAGFGGYIGQTGESELTTNIEVVQLLDDAQGTVVQDEIITGYSAEITIPLREMSTQRWQDLVGEVTGNNITISGQEITGLGTKKLYQSMFNYSGRLVGHPIRNLETNISEDIVMLNTAPKLESINFSGSSIQEASFLFTSYKDANAAEEINLLARGDHSKF
jgi:hypothetical protein